MVTPEKIGERDSDRCENKEGDQGKCYKASTTGEKLLLGRWWKRSCRVAEVREVCDGKKEVACPGHCV